MRYLRFGLLGDGVQFATIIAADWALNRTRRAMTGCWTGFVEVGMFVERAELFGSDQARLALRSPDVSRRRIRRARWTAPTRVPYQIDGDYAGRLPVEIEVLGRVTLLRPVTSSSPWQTADVCRDAGVLFSQHCTSDSRSLSTISRGKLTNKTLVVELVFFASDLISDLTEYFPRRPKFRIDVNELFQVHMHITFTFASGKPICASVSNACISAR